MLYVIIALLPTSLFGIYNFGYKALVLILSNDCKLCGIRVGI